MAIHCHTTIDVGELPLDPRIDTAITPDGDLHLTLRYREHSVSVYGKAAEVADLLGKLHQRAVVANASYERRRSAVERRLAQVAAWSTHQWPRSLDGPSIQRTVDEALR